MSKNRPGRLASRGSPVCRRDPQVVTPLKGPASGSGARGSRTPDILLAKQALYQLSYGPDKRVRQLGCQRWDWEELNLRPHAYQACALTT